MMLYICTKFNENMSKGFSVIKGLYFHYSTFSKGHNSVTILVELWSLISAHRLVMLYICIKSMKIYQRVSELLSGHDYKYFLFSQGNYSVKCRWSYGTCSLHVV